MERTGILLMLLLCVGLTACGGTPSLACDEPQRYKAAVDGKRILAPEGLTQLDPLKEIPLPEPSPQPPRPAGSPCLDLPPGTFSQGTGDKASEDNKDDESDSSE